MKLIKKHRGFTLVELILTLGIISIISFLAFQKLSQEFENKQAAALGDQIKNIGMAVNNYIVNHYNVLSNLANAAGGSLDMGPRTCDITKKTCTITTQTLVNEGLLPPAFTNKSIYSLGYNIELKRSGTSPYWNVTGLITTNNALLDRGKIRYDILGKAMLEAGVDSGMTRISANKLDGYKGSWSATSSDYSIVNKQGLLGYIAGYGSNSYSAFLRRDGTLPMTGDLNMGTKNIYNAANVTASGTGNFGGEVISGSWVHAKNGYGDQISLGGDAATNDYELRLSANKPLSIHGPSPVQVNVSGALRATTDLTADRNISAGGSVSAGSWVNAKNGYGDQISLGGDAGGNDYELRISNPSRQITVYSPSGTTKMTVTGTFTAGEDIRANRNLSVGGTITASGNIKTNADLNANRVYSNYIKSNGAIDAAGAVNATGRVSANEFLYLGRSAVEGAGCSPNGLQGRTSTGAILSCVSGKWKGASGKIKSTQLSQNGYLGAFDVCAISRVGNVEDSHYCQIYESPVGSRNWYKNDYKSGCIATCMSISAN